MGVPADDRRLARAQCRGLESGGGIPRGNQSPRLRQQRCRPRHFRPVDGSLFCSCRRGHWSGHAVWRPANLQKVRAENAVLFRGQGCQGFAQAVPDRPLPVCAEDTVHRSVWPPLSRWAHRFPAVVPAGRRGAQRRVHHSRAGGGGGARA